MRLVRKVISRRDIYVDTCWSEREELGKNIPERGNSLFKDHKI